MNEKILKENVFKNNWESNEILDNKELLKKSFEYANVPALEQIKQAININLTEMTVKAMNKNSKSQYFLARVWIWATIIFSIIGIRATIIFSK